jgi:hypothetical protein
VTAISTSLEPFRHRSKRVWTLYKRLTVREGIGRETDKSPDRWATGPGFKEYVSEMPLTRNLSVKNNIDAQARDRYKQLL